MPPNPLSHVLGPICLLFCAPQASASFPTAECNSIVAKIIIYIGGMIFPSYASTSLFHSLQYSTCLPRPENDSDFRGISPPHIRGSHGANAELAFPFMLCPWDYHINLRDLITRLRLAARALDQVIPPLLPSN